MQHPVDMSFRNPSITGQAKSFDQSMAVQAVSRRVKNIGIPLLIILRIMLDKLELCLHALQCLH